MSASGYDRVGADRLVRGAREAAEAPSGASGDRPTPSPVGPCVPEGSRCSPTNRVARDCRVDHLPASGSSATCQSVHRLADTTTGLGQLWGHCQIPHRPLIHKNQILRAALERRERPPRGRGQACENAHGPAPVPGPWAGGSLPSRSVLPVRRRPTRPRRRKTRQINYNLLSYKALLLTSPTWFPH